jgi:hypothetical protein
MGFYIFEAIALFFPCETAAKNSNKINGLIESHAS